METGKQSQNLDILGNIEMLAKTFPWKSDIWSPYASNMLNHVSMLLIMFLVFC